MKSKQSLSPAGGAGDERSAPAPHTAVEHLVQSRNPSPDSLSFGAVLLGDGWAHQPGVDLESRGRDVNSVQALEVPAAPEFAHPHETLVGGGALLPGKLDNAVGDSELRKQCHVLGPVFANQEGGRGKGTEEPGQAGDQPPALLLRRSEIMDRLERIDDDDL